jgi:hypothetical protein
MKTYNENLHVMHLIIIYCVLLIKLDNRHTC